MAPKPMKRAASPIDLPPPNKRRNISEATQDSSDHKVMRKHVSAEQCGILKIVESLIDSKDTWAYENLQFHQRAGDYLTVLESQCRFESWTTEHVDGISGILGQLQDLLCAKTSDELTFNMVFGHLTGFVRGMQVHPVHKTLHNRRDEDDSSMRLYYNLHGRMIELANANISLLQRLGAGCDPASVPGSAATWGTASQRASLDKLRGEVKLLKKDLAKVVTQATKNMAEVEDAFKQRCKSIRERHANLVEVQIKKSEEKAKEYKGAIRRAQHVLATKDTEIERLRSELDEADDKAKQLTAILVDTNDFLSSDDSENEKFTAVSDQEALTGHEAQQPDATEADTIASQDEGNEARQPDATDADTIASQDKGTVSPAELAHMVRKKCEIMRIRCTSEVHVCQGRVSFQNALLEHMTLERDRAVSEQAALGHTQEVHHRMHSIRTAELQKREKSCGEREKMLEEKEQAIAEEEYGLMVAAKSMTERERRIQKQIEQVNLCTCRPHLAATTTTGTEPEVDTSTEKDTTSFEGYVSSERHPNGSSQSSPTG